MTTAHQAIRNTTTDGRVAKLLGVHDSTILRKNRKVTGDMRDISRQPVSKDFVLPGERKSVRRSIGFWKQIGELSPDRESKKMPRLLEQQRRIKEKHLIFILYQ